MDVAALILWILTAGGGFVLLGTWLAQGGTRGGSRLPTPVIFGHFLLAATGLVLWIIYVANDSTALAWTSFGILVAVALLGFTMFYRWLNVRSGAAVGAGVSAGGGPGNVGHLPESRFPVPIVYLHGLLGATTLVLVLLAAINAD